ncbi:aldehyde dehydrogenase (NADP(+)) [Nesterenkonia muleiensis]|uniref:aldehyde dehydrogenase (NADP(+)) n=1 Tax=Nesterenkonia muleiensis TaxID=2282648 RepID=UPI000E7591C4|nr:aldehyde dehydrogenase (NADP(+)) [Nesterenkonia muleiensis]
MPTTELTGCSIIGGETVRGGAGTIHGVDPRTSSVLGPSYHQLGTDQLRIATAAAHEATSSFGNLDPSEHAQFLDKMAENIEAVRDELIERAMAETGLSRDRLQVEHRRTSNQLRLFASVVRRGDHRGVRIDPALPDREPLPRPDIRQRKIPVGPVVVFGASNFPLAFSTAGGDTASALAAGCPVIVKAHNAHPGTGELVGWAVTKAVQECGLHPGVFSLLYGAGSVIGQALVSDPLIKAVGFTGSRDAGTALMRTAAQRTEPIPVYAEMSSINPVIVFDSALDEDMDALAQAFVASVTGSSGQLCTVPGLIFVPEGIKGDAFATAVGRALSTTTGQTMLTEPIATSWTHGVETLASQDNVSLVGQGEPGPNKAAPAPAVYGTDLGTFTGNEALHREIFGAAALLVRYGSVAELKETVARMEGQLTATLHLTEASYDDALELLPVLEQRVGRILVNGWPTGVEVGHAMVHGGPFPATSEGRTTSVGTFAIERFLRPVAYQNLPQELLPEPLRHGNPWHLTQMIEGVITPPDSHR